MLTRCISAAKASIWPDNSSKHWQILSEPLHYRRIPRKLRTLCGNAKTDWTEIKNRASLVTSWLAVPHKQTCRQAMFPLKWEIILTRSQRIKKKKILMLLTTTFLKMYRFWKLLRQKSNLSLRRSPIYNKSLRIPPNPKETLTTFPATKSSFTTNATTLNGLWKICLPGSRVWSNQRRLAS